MIKTIKKYNNYYKMDFRVSEIIIFRLSYKDTYIQILGKVDFFAFSVFCLAFWITLYEI